MAACNASPTPLMKYARSQNSTVLAGQLPKRPPGCCFSFEFRRCHAQAGLIICYAGTGRTASLVAKYRPNVPILTLVVPQLRSKGLAWELEGRSLARQFLIMRGACLPVLLCDGLQHALVVVVPCRAMVA